jgi:hypothetical protein
VYGGVDGEGDREGRGNRAAASGASAARLDTARASFIKGNARLKAGDIVGAVSAYLDAAR